LGSGMDGKWISGLSPEMEVASAAKKVLSARLDAVRYWLPLVAHAEKDVEFVHQLRVTSRRAGAALRLFRPCFRNKAYRNAKRLLREVRQAAGEARDWDVFQETLFEENVPGTRLRDFLFGYAISRRMLAQASLSEMAFDLRQPLDLLRDELDELLQCPDEEDARNYGELCFRAVRELLGELHRATNPVPDDYRELHQIRILGKKLRYVLELAVDCFTTPTREAMLPKVEGMQRILGEANDAQVLSQRLKEIGYFAKKFRPNEYPLIEADLEAILHDQREKLDLQKTLFHRWLKEWEEADHPVYLRTAPPAG
jgi:CHAD domain-containing protein